MATQPIVLLTDDWQDITTALSLEAGKRYYFDAKGFALAIRDVLTSDGTPDNDLEGQDLFPMEGTRPYDQGRDNTCWAKSLTAGRDARLLMTEAA